MQEKVFKVYLDCKWLPEKVENWPSPLGIHFFRIKHTVFSNRISNKKRFFPIELFENVFFGFIENVVYWFENVGFQISARIFRKLYIAICSPRPPIMQSLVNFNLTLSPWIKSDDLLAVNSCSAAVGAVSDQGISCQLDPPFLNQILKILYGGIR